MSSISITFLGKNYVIPQEVKEYVYYSQWYNPFYAKILEPLSSYLHSNTNVFNTIDWKAVLTPIAQEIIQELATLRVYNITVSDLVENNEGFAQLVAINKECDEKAKNILRQAYNDYMNQYQNAYYQATSQITGTGTSVYTSDPLAYLVFANRETNAINRQAAQARIEYTNAIDRLNRSNSNWLDKHMSELRLMEYWPACANAVNLFSQQTFATIIESLNRAGIFNYDAIRHYDIKRSTDILDNLDLVNDKKSIVLEAFSVCPYNERIFSKALENGVIDDGFIATMESLGFEVSKEAVVNSSKKMSMQDNIKSVIESIATRYHLSKQELSYEVLSERIEQIRGSYSALDKAETDDKELNAWIQERISTKADVFAETSSKSIHEVVRLYIQEQFPKVVLIQLIDNEIQVPEFGDEHSYFDIQKNAEKRLFERLLQYQKKIKGIVDSSTGELHELGKEIAVRKDRIREVQEEIKKCSEKKEGLGIFAVSEKRQLGKRILSLKEELESDRLTKELTTLVKRGKEIKRKLDSLLCLPDRLVKKSQETFEVKKFY